MLFLDAIGAQSRQLFLFRSQGLQVRTSDNDTGEFILDLQSSSSATGTDYASKFVVEKGGNVGIGETSPLVPLHISRDSASGENIA
ncbi:hypothetical protein, partial [Marivivens sp.]|uniref:hypothetical protein n=1 Tax=Marivivens sp. TaxID=1978374 RepID=UPI0025C024A4